MAQGEFTKEECTETVTAVDEMFKAIPKNKQVNFIGHLNDFYLFMQAATIAAPHEQKKTPPEIVEG